MEHQEFQNTKEKGFMEKSERGSPNQEKVIELDKQLRRMIADYYIAVKELNNQEKAVALLADHVAILVEMINEIKTT